MQKKNYLRTQMLWPLFLSVISTGIYYSGYQNSSNFAKAKLRETVSQANAQRNEIAFEAYLGQAKFVLSEAKC